MYFNFRTEVGVNDESVPDAMTWQLYRSPFVSRLVTGAPPLCVFGCVAIVLICSQLQMSVLPHRGLHFVMGIR